MEAVRRFVDGETAVADGIEAGLVELGLSLMLLDEADGGLGMGLLEAALVQQMVRQQIAAGEREPLKIVVCPTLREPSGLALSSRNRRLSEQELTVARQIYPALQTGAALAPDVAAVVSAARAAMPSEARLDYLELVDPLSFEKLDHIPEHGARLIVAAWVGKVRLIDNLLIGG